VRKGPVSIFLQRVAPATALAALLGLAACGSPGSSSPAAQSQDMGNQTKAANANPDLDPGSPLGNRAAPDFRLTNQFGQPMSLSQFRGKIVVLAFVDSQCTTVCPLTTVSMLEARQLLGANGSHVQLLGIDANPAAESVGDVLAYSRVHQMVNQWDFLTGTDSQLKAVWKAYGIYVQIEHGQVDHTPALYVISQQGREEKIYLTSMAYASVGQEAQVVAAEAATLLPGHPRLATESSLAYIGGIGPASPVTLPGVPSGSVSLDPGKPHVLMFFATWLAETSGLRSRLLALNQYARAAAGGKLPGLVAVDEAVTEPSPDSAATYLKQLGAPLDYPVALDTNGRLADGYNVQDQPWFAVTSASGKIIWSHDGWVSAATLEAAAARASTHSS
jgi:cytochrome oxidase Cu insertion factor (SCO1/SenC/PrrC family)